MKTLSKDTRGFIDGVVKYIRNDSRGKEIIPRVSALFTKVTSAAKKERIATVTSAVLLTESEKKAVAGTLTGILSHDVECRFSVTPELLGGLRITVADWVVDTSLSGQLMRLTQSLQ
jgi:F-type H+-transporting ATPase subunit delta